MLRFSGNLRLAVGSITRIEISSVAGTRDQINVARALGLRSTLRVPKLGGSVAAGDAASLFAAGTRSGAFATLDLPDLGLGLGSRLHFRHRRHLSHGRRRAARFRRLGRAAIPSDRRFRRPWATLDGLGTPASASAVARLGE